MFHVVLVEPEIPANTGNVARSCLAAGATLHLVKPLGFSIDDRNLRRAGLDYWHEVSVREWASLESFLGANHGRARLFFFTTKAERPYWEGEFQPGDLLVFGRETKGLPESLLETHRSQCLTIPMPGKTRSLNLATAAGIVLFDAMRQVASRART